ncbi:hypothetical protein EJB00_00470 [Wolbachia endosymbiont of Drosophila mauritiana]|uniref:hypothetical protein n=1 Tax=unclassified Wolbachia TaxID=2640676 RepID=UPI00107EBA78|nr:MULTISPECIES: hypothetical protein [unclassified Wolbachia]QCB62173.1 hypothetical protein EJA99_00470 [Wolbachia endosymbiont of Drosophila mauritiana]QCB63219.1 hypothetical protein EJB00_00470 [Wolbachia endosymbiont of Drosophila mauritiana]QWE33647.1 Uncharacterized protein WwMa_07620 [Wolbachia endosymbiont of Drosophila simulans]TGB06809.1 hypothetical protein E5C28_02750 [Wolbachia endosymbiont of Drosophila mauritiana]
MPKYVNRIAESIVLKVYTDKKNAKIRVFSKTKDGEVEKTLSKQQIVEFLNLLTNVRNQGNKELAISKNVERGIVEDIEGICRENGRYVYKAPDLSAEEQYNKLFESEQAIQFNLNTFMLDSISKIVQLKDRFEEILGFSLERGLCHSLNYFITFLKLENKQDFVRFLESDNIISEQDFMNYIDGRKEQTIKLLMMKFLSQFLPILDVQSIKKREGDTFYSDETIYEQLCDDLSSTKLWIDTEQEQIKRVLNDVEIGCYLEFSSFCFTYNRADSKGAGHFMLVYKAENNKYIFFDSNKGAVGFCPDTGAANFTLEDVCRVMELAVNRYSYDMYIENFADYCQAYIMLRNATLILKKAEKLYETMERTNSRIIDISVDKGMNQLLLTPASL